jgi:A-kinase anchor protein 10
MAKAGTYQVSMDTQESSFRLIIATRNSPLKELSGKQRFVEKMDC